MLAVGMVAAVTLLPASAGAQAFPEQRQAAQDQYDGPPPVAPPAGAGQQQGGGAPGRGQSRGPSRGGKPGGRRSRDGGTAGQGGGKNRRDERGQLPLSEPDRADLPFTGLDLTLLLYVGGLLVLLGCLVKAAERRLGRGSAT